MSNSNQLELFEPTTNFERVGQFMQLMGQQVQITPKIPDEAVVKLRNALIEEEFDELLEGVVRNDIVAIADALTDLLYVIYGAGHAYGINLDRTFEEVHRSNLTKRQADGTVLKDANGKVIKPATYEPPNLQAILGR